MKDWTAEERALFEESRKLKEKARGLVRARHIKEESERNAKAYAEAAERRREQLRTAEAEKRALDGRIRYALMGAASAMKAGGVLFKGPETSLCSRQDMHSFVVIDQKTNEQVQVYVNSTGFEWD